MPGMYSTQPSSVLPDNRKQTGPTMSFAFTSRPRGLRGDTIRPGISRSIIWRPTA
jgi:hypothetical protein